MSEKSKIYQLKVADFLNIKSDSFVNEPKQLKEIKIRALVTNKI